MADRMFFKGHDSLECGVVDLFCAIDIGTTGSVSGSSGKGVSTVVRNSAGNFTVTLADTYNSLLWADVTLLDDTSSNPATAAVAARIYSEAVATDKTVILQGYAFDDGAAADFVAGAKLLVKLTLKNSSV